MVNSPLAPFPKLPGPIKRRKDHNVSKWTRRDSSATQGLSGSKEKLHRGTEVPGGELPDDLQADEGRAAVTPDREEESVSEKGFGEVDQGTLSTGRVPGCLPLQIMPALSFQLS